MGISIKRFIFIGLCSFALIFADFIRGVIMLLLNL